MTIHTDNKETLQNALKRIGELEAQIEKMKCCGNCKYQSYEFEYTFCSNKKHCIHYDKWELRR